MLVVTSIERLLVTGSPANLSAEELAFGILSRRYTIDGAPEPELEHLNSFALSVHRDLRH